METGYSTRKNSSDLKLVHPGCFIEKYRKPITAAEVMRRHPRHYVARSDVFTNPWIVVRPESSQSFADVAEDYRLGKGRPGQDSSAEMTNSMKTVVERLIRKRTSMEGYFGKETSERSARKDGILSGKQSDRSQDNYPVKKYLDRSSIGNSFSSTDHRDGSNNATELKSCLKKPKHKLNNLRVRFKLPGDEGKIEMNTILETQRTTSMFI